MSRTPVLICPECKKKAIIKKSVRLHDFLTYRYCSCSDPECGLTFRTKEEFEKILSPSSKSFNKLKEHMKDSPFNFDLNFI